MTRQAAREPFVREVTVERVVPGGDGLAHVDGVVALVAGALPGDRVIAELTVESPRLLRGRVVDVRAAGGHRRAQEAVCPRAKDGSCGGCDWPALRPESAARLKSEIVFDALRRIARLGDDEIPEPSFVPSRPNYRLRNRLHLDAEGRLGFFGPRSRQVSDLAVCEIVSKELLARLPAIRDSLRAVGPVEGELSTLENCEGTIVLGELRLGVPTGPGDSTKPKRGPFDGFRLVASDGRVLLEDGPLTLDLVVGSASFRVSVSSFFQGNRFLLDPFLEEIRTALLAVRRKEKERRGTLNALDLYAGVGFLTRPLLEVTAGSSGRVVAVEVEASSWSDLSENLGRWEIEGLPAARCVRATAEAFLSSDLTWKNPGDVDVVVADPPRAGLSPVVRQGILRLLPRALLLVSCDPPTLARDLGALGEAYRLSRLTLLDLFPGTHHVESVALLLRRDEGPSVVR